MLTEQISPRYAGMGSWHTAEILNAMYEGQLAAVAAVGPALPRLAAAVEGTVPALQRGGRLIYVGAGTSGRIGVQDGVELTPTFDWPTGRTAFLLAGGPGALLNSIEGAEDNEAAGAMAVEETGVGPHDVVIAVAASGKTPYTLGALRASRERGALTIAIANNTGAPLLSIAHHPIAVPTGGEVIAGSTRMKAGTAQKIVLNLFSTAVMVKLNRVYRGLMVHMRATNDKLRRRAEGIVHEIAGCGEAEAARCLYQANGDVKTAILLGFGVQMAEASALLARHGDNLREAIAELSRR
ncbi:MAG: N-acetylmuramic acid 6-phosphate etherase [Alphaproteobacteria bacterium]|nr:N-acetylmuramic acid 6-phosphate etherase [Alphaproteobacteria bacterium]